MRALEGQCTRRLVTAVAVCGCAWLAAAIGGAADASDVTFVVTSTVDDVDAHPGDGRCETVEGNGECTLRAAVQETNALAAPDQIFLPPGRYVLTRSGFNEEGGALGDLDVHGEVAIRGSGTASTFISETGSGVDRILDVHEDAALTISQLAIVDLFQSFYGADPSCGGALLVRGEATVDDVAIRNNVKRRSGAGICNLGGKLAVRRATIDGNLAGVAGSGGGIENRGAAEVIDSVISNNRAFVEDGGGVYNSGDITIVNSTISGNATTQGVTLGWGGGIANRGGTVTLINTTVTGNAAEISGGGIYNFGGTVTFANTIVASNSDGDCDGQAPITSTGHNLDSDGTCGLTSAGDLSGVDPMLGPLADNGGPTQTHALLAGSPAIDAGDDTQCPDTDQRGAPRPFDGDGVDGPACDIGSYEFGSQPPPPPPPQSGDVDCNTVVDAIDALSVLRHVAGLPPLAACLERADVNCDAAIDAVDALLILRYVAALPVSLPPGCPPIGPPPE